MRRCRSCCKVSSSEQRCTLNPHSSLSVIDACKIGRAYADALEGRPAPEYQEEMYIPPEFNYALREQDTLRALWESLKDLDWAEYGCTTGFD